MIGSIGVTGLAVYVQENGIIRAESDHRLLGRIDSDLTYEDIQNRSCDHVIYTVDEMEHILNCFDNLFYIDSLPTSEREETIGIIRTACQNARQKWNKVVRRKLEIDGGESK